MKHCSKCSAELEDDQLICPVCGAEQEAPAEETVPAQETPVEETPAQETPAEEAPAEEAPVEEAPAAEAPAAEAPKKKSKLGWILALIVAVLLVVAVIVGKGSHDQARDAVVDAQHTNAYGLQTWSVYQKKDAETGETIYSYMNENGETVPVTPEEVDTMLAEVVATLGDIQMTNRDLQYYFQQEFYNFYSIYGQYLAMMMDPSKSLGEQTDLTGSATWQSSFLDSAFHTFQEVAALNLAAREAGFELPEEEQAELEELLDLESVAKQYGYEDVDRFLEENVGPGSDAESYAKYMKLNVMGTVYGNYLMDQLTFADEDVEAYYDENAEMFQGNYGIQKVDKPMVNVRHILVKPEETTGEDGKPVISEEAWAAAEAQAQEIYEGWQSGAATEDSFADAASANTADPGSAQNGGLYQGVYPGQMVPEFNDWCFADGRQPGDHGIVKTQYGYHIMYYVGAAEQIYWRAVVEQMLRQEQGGKDREALVAQYESQILKDQAMLLDTLAPTVPAPAEEAPAEDVPTEEAPAEPAPTEEKPAD